MQTMIAPYPNGRSLPVGTRVVHLEHGPLIVSKKSKKSESPYCVWVKDETGIEGTVDIRLLRWP